MNHFKYDDMHDEIKRSIESKNLCYYSIQNLTSVLNKTKD